MTTKRAITIRNALATAILSAKVNELTDTKDITVLEYWLHCYYVAPASVFSRIINAMVDKRISDESIIDIYSYIAVNQERR